MGFTCCETKNSGCCLLPIAFREIEPSERRDTLRSMVDGSDCVENITLCAGCTHEFNLVGRDAPHIIEFLHDNLRMLPRFKKSFSVALEPGCAAMDLKSDMIEIVKRMGLRYVNNAMGCCGNNGNLTPLLMTDREEECMDADLIVVGCPQCLCMYDNVKSGMPVVYIGELVAIAAGHTESLKHHKIKVDIDF